MMLKKKFPVYAILGASLLLAACQDTSMRDLKSFTENAHKDTKPEIEPLPAIRPYEGFAYSASELADPFSAQNLKPESRTTDTDGGPGPDTNRRREPLEQFSLSGLQMVGTMTRDENRWVVISAPDGTVHRITIGNYLGQDFGQVTRIEDAEIEITEMVQDYASNGWVSRTVSLRMVE